MSITFSDELKALANAVAQHEQAVAIDTSQKSARSERCRQNANETQAPTTKETRASIIEGLSNGEKLTTNALAKKLGRERSTILRYLNDMAEDGALKRSGKRSCPEWEVAP